MVVIKEADDPPFFRFITDGNLLRQFDFLKYAVEIALRNANRPISHEVVRQINNQAVVFLCDCPGRYRQEPVYIKNSPHIPPPYGDVPDLMEECLKYLGDHWADRSTTHLAAYALWRLNWVHPFVEGNGRTARATSYYILCVKHGMWLPGTVPIPQLISRNRAPYYAALGAADLAWNNGGVDVSALEGYLDGLLADQLAS